MSPNTLIHEAGDSMLTRIMIDGMKPNQNAVNPGPVAGGADPDILS